MTKGLTLSPTRRTVLGGIGAATVAGFFPGFTNAQTAEPIRLGFQLHRTGIGASYGRWYERTATAALARLMRPLVQMLQDFEREGFAPLQQRFAARDVLQGHEVTTSDGLQGLCLGVSASGALRLADAHGVRDIHSSEVSVRPLKQDKD